VSLFESMDATPKTTIILATHSSDPALELRGVQRFADGSGFSSRMFVRCHGFSAERPFYFSENSFGKALENLREMNKELKGEARFEEDFEHDQYLDFSMRPLGHVLVTGHLVLLSGETNRLSFAFMTDQTVLAPLISALETFEP